MKIVRYTCGCNNYKNRCYQLGNNHYIVLPSVDDNDNVEEIVFSMRVSEISQKGRHFWVGGHKAMEIDLLCDVPQIEDHEDQQTFANSLLGKENYPKYQRRLDVGRARDYGQWWSQSDKASVNAVTLAVHKDYSVAEQDDGETILWKEFVDDGEVHKINIRGTWLGSSCASCGNIEQQLQRIVGGLPGQYQPAEIKSATKALEAIELWKDENGL